MFTNATAPVNVMNVISRIRHYEQHMTELAEATRKVMRKVPGAQTVLKSRLNSAAQQAETSVNDYKSQLGTLRELRRLVTAKKGENVYEGFKGDIVTLDGLVKGDIPTLAQVERKINMKQLRTPQEIRAVVNSISFVTSYTRFKTLLHETIMRRQKEHVGKEVAEMSIEDQRERELAASADADEEKLIRMMHQLEDDLEASGWFEGAA